MPKRVLYLIRNAEYNRAQVDKEGNAPLTERGERQAKLTGNALKDLPIQQIFVSGHQQTIGTAEIVSGQMKDSLEVVIRLELNQYTSVENTHDTKSLKPKVDSEQEQLEKAYRKLFIPAEDEDIHQILICHGNIVLDLICYATQVNPQIWAHMLINNTGISIISIDSEREIELVAFNDVRHLPGDIRTE